MPGEASGSSRRALDALLAERPRFHGRQQAGTASYSIRTRVLDWIVEHVPSGSRTLETGCGYSTVVLTSLTAEHTAISPFAEEHALIVSWCARHEIATDHLHLIASPSQEVLPGLRCGELDFVLIDGDHAFPAPFIDWYYTADNIREAGFLVVDDTEIPTGRILSDFLKGEVGRWDLADEIGKTAIFRRVTSEPVAKGISWTQQPYCQSPAASTSVLGRARRMLGRS